MGGDKGSDILYERNYFKIKKIDMKPLRLMHQARCGGVCL